MKVFASVAAALLSMNAVSGCSSGYPDTLATPDGSLKGMTVPITLASGDNVRLFIPVVQAQVPYAVYLPEGDGLTG